MADVADIIGMLDRDGALRLDDRGDYGTWDEPADSEVAIPVDFDSLGQDDLAMEQSLSPRYPVNQSSPDRERSGIFVSSEIADSVLSGDRSLRGRNNAFPPMEVLAWYQPFHFFANNWGIFIRERSLVMLAADLAPRFAQFENRRSRLAHVAILIRAAFAYTFLHEHYHHKIESLAIRLHVVEQRAIYPDYRKRVAQVVAGTDDAIEEALANADAYQRLASRPYATWFASDERKVIREWMLDTFRASPPGYSGALNLLDMPSIFNDCESRLISQVQEGALSVRKHFTDFQVSTHLTRSMFNIKQHVWSLVPVGDNSILPTIEGAIPLTTAKLERCLRRLGWEHVKGGKGSHFKYSKPGCKMIILSDRKDVTMPVLVSTARTLGYTVVQLCELAR